MIISKTPLRISFLGGGTDYPNYFNNFGEGAVLGTTIDKYIYLSITKFYSKLFDHPIRIAYSQIENVDSINEIKHGPFRECLRLHGICNNVELNYSAELPAYTGLGSSSSFTIGLLNSIHAFKNNPVDKNQLVQEAIHVERDILHESVGYQDQTFAAHGGFNIIKFRNGGEIEVKPIPISQERKKNFENHLILFFTGIKRRAADVIHKQLKKVDENKKSLQLMRSLVDDGYNLLAGDSNLEGFGNLLHKNWILKRSLDDSISNNIIDKIYEDGMKSGALGGKLLGAGGGGFIIFFVPLDSKQKVREKLNYLTEIPIKIDSKGSQILKS